MKYLMFEVNGIPAPVLFPDHVKHSEVAAASKFFDTVASAGFVEIGETVRTYGQSVGLNLSSRPEDARFIEIMIGKRERVEA